MRIAWLLLAASISCISSVQAATWQEANKQSVEYMEAGDLKRASASAEDAVKLYAARDSIKPENLATLILVWADIHRQFDDWRGAERAVKKGISTFRSRVGEGDYAIVALYKEQAQILRRGGDYDGMYRAWMRALGLGENILGGDSIGYADLKMEAVRALKQFRQYSWLDAQLKVARDIYVNKLGPDHKATVLPEFELAKLSLEAEHLDTAYERYVALLDRIDPLDDDLTDLRLTATGHLMAIYRKRGKEELVDELFAKLLASPLPDMDAKLLIGELPEIRSSTAGSSDGGTVLVEYEIGTDGRARNMRLVSNSAHKSFYDAVKREVENYWRYLPARRGGEPVVTPAYQLRASLTVSREARTGSRLAN